MAYETTRDTCGKRYLGGIEYTGYREVEIEGGRRIAHGYRRLIPCPFCEAAEAKRRQAEERRVERERQAELRRIERERQAELRRIEREREAERRRAEQKERASRVPSNPASPARNSQTSNADVASQLTSLSELFRQGVLTSEQFEAAKNKLLGLDSPTSPTGRNPKETIVIDGGNVIRTAGSADVTITVNGKTVQTSRGRIEENNSEDSAE